MDSTSNFWANVTNIDVHGDACNDVNPVEHLPDLQVAADTDRCGPGSVPLEATEHPTKGQWLYFVSIGQDGTTLFASTTMRNTNAIGRKPATHRPCPPDADAAR